MPEAEGETFHLVDPDPLSSAELLRVLAREYGAREPKLQLFTDDLEKWRTTHDVEFHETVDKGDEAHTEHGCAEVHIALDLLGLPQGTRQGGVAPDVSDPGSEEALRLHRPAPLHRPDKDRATARRRQSAASAGGRHEKRDALHVVGHREDVEGPQ